jgi:deazaflavin-dependent oxidoreductase (nitroreductase family)
VVLPSDWPTHPFCYLTTTGRRSGRPHRIEIWFVVEGRDVWLLTEREPETDWVRNLRLEPAVTLEVAGRRFHARADVVEIEPEHVVRAALATRYASVGDDLADWASEALAVRVSVS